MEKSGTKPWAPGPRHNKKRVIFMAIGDDAARRTFPLVPNAGEDGKVRYGAREINRTRDFVAQTLDEIEAVWPITRGGTGGITKSAARTGLGISSGTANPTAGQDGDIYFKIV